MGLSKIMPVGRVCIGRISVLTAVTITITIITNIRGTPPTLVALSHTPSPAADLGALASCGFSSLKWLFGVRTVRHESPHSFHTSPSFVGARVTCRAGKRASWPETRHRSSPAPVSMTAGQRAQLSRAGHAPAAAYVTRRAARSQTPAGAQPGDRVAEEVGACRLDLE